MENISGRIRINNNTDSLFTIHNYGRIDLQDDVYLTGNYYDSVNDTTYTGGYELYLYENSEMYLRGAELCVGADEEYYPIYDGGKVIQEGKAVIQLEDSALFHITSIDTLGAGHFPTGGIWKIDASSDKHAKIGGEEVATALQDGDRILIEKKGEIQGNEVLHPRTVSYLDIIRSDAGSTHWQGVEFNSTIDDAFDNDYFGFSNCLFKSLRSFSICSLDSLEVNFADCHFEENYRSLYITYRKEVNGGAVETSNNVNATVTSCTFYDNYNGILIESASGPENLNYLHVNSSDFGKLVGETASRGNSFGVMAVGEELEATITDCEFYDNSYGVFANSTLCNIGEDHDGNNFQYNEKPLYMSTMNDTFSIITYNTISNNETNGIYCYLGEFGINNNTISVNDGHGVVAISSVISDDQIRLNDINNNGSIEIYASAENMRQLEGGENIIEDDDYVIPPSIIPLSVWKYYSDFDRYILAAEDADSLMNVFGNTIPDSTDSLRFYPSDSLYVFTESRNSSYNEGIAAYNSGDYNTAISELSEFISENPYMNRSYSALPYLYFAERRTSGNMSGYRQFSDSYLPYTVTDTLMYWQMKMLYAVSHLADYEYPEAIGSYQEILENAPSYDDSLQASIMQGYAYLKLTQEGERNSNIECYIQTPTLEDYCEYLLHCTDEEPGSEEVIPVISRVFNYPNPFNPETKICFQLREPSERATVTVYNIKGQKVWEYTEYDLESGNQEVIWSGRNRSGRQVASGVYLYRIKADGCKRASKMLLLK